MPRFPGHRATFLTWIEQADLDEGLRADGLTTVEREEPARLRRENRELKLERDNRAVGPGSRRRRAA